VGRRDRYPVVSGFIDVIVVIIGGLGASMGIGEAFTEALAKKGLNIVLVARSEVPSPPLHDSTRFPLISSNLGSNEPNRNNA